MGLWTYALVRSAHTDNAAVDAIRRRTLAAAQAVVTRTRASGYINSMKADRLRLGIERRRCRIRHVSADRQSVRAES